MPKRTTQERAPCLLGDSAAAIEIAVHLLIDAVAVQAPGVACAMLAELDTLIARRLPTPGLHSSLVGLREHIAHLVSLSDGQAR